MQEEAKNKFAEEDKLVKLCFSLSYVFLALGAVLGIIQLITRTPGFPKLLSAKLYYLSMTTHGIVLAIAWTTFSIFGSVLYLLVRALRENLHSIRLAWGSFLATLLGTALAALMLLTGSASVGWTFYAPLRASPAFYIGLVIFIVGTWIFTAEVLLTVKKWREKNTDIKLPLAVHGIIAVFILWIISTLPIAVEELFLRIPWAFNPARGIDVLLSKTLFWWFGHPLVYFWIMPAVIIWYVFIPKILNTKLFSDFFARLVFVLFVIFSIPVGVHHQYADPGISMLAKYIFAVFTYAVGMPSMLTAFNIAATLERYAREKGAKGLLSWLFALPWKNAPFAALALAIILFGLGGITGFVNAGYTLNQVVHNTSWIVGHFHLTVGSGFTLTMIGLSYFLIPRLFKRKLYSEKAALSQVWLWFIGVLIFALGMKGAGLLGSPRRTYDLTYFGSEAAKAWVPYLTFAALGGILMFVSLILFLAVIALTMYSGESFEEQEEETKEEVKQEKLGLVDNLKLFALIAFFLTLAVYIPTIIGIIGINAPKAIGALP